MTKSTLVAFVAFVALATLTTSGCRKKVEAPPPAPAPVAKAAPAPAPHVQEMIANFAKVHFETDQSDLDEQSKAALEANAKIMQSHTDITIEVQGHADERGTTDYNVALGDRRATAVQTHMRMLGVSPTRVNTVSYGEEKPVASGHNEVAWSQNRRAEFRILTGSSATGTTP